MTLHLAAIVLLSVSPAFADGGTCAGCHTASKAQTNDGFIQDPDAFAFLQDQGSPAPQKPAKTQTCATCHTQPSNTSALQPFSLTSKDDQAAINSWLQAQNGQVAVAPQKNDPFARPAIPCKVNCHTPNGSGQLLAQAGSAWGGVRPFDAAAMRAFLEAGSARQPDARDTPDPDVPAQGDGDPQGGAPPKPDPKNQATPAPQKTDPKSEGAVTPKKTEKDAQDQLGQTAADQGSGDDFDGSENGGAVTPDAGTEAGTGSKKSPAGEAYPKPKGPSSKISEVPDSSAQGSNRYAPQTSDAGPRPEGSNMTGALILGGSAGALFGLGLGGPLGMAVGTAVGAGLGALLSWLF